MTQPGTRGWIDVSVMARHGMPHWPDNPPITGGRYEMICLPVKLDGSDGAPARAILRPMAGHSPDPATPVGAAR